MMDDTLSIIIALFTNITLFSVLLNLTKENTFKDLCFLLFLLFYNLYVSTTIFTL